MFTLIYTFLEIGLKGDEIWEHYGGAQHEYINHQHFFNIKYKFLEIGLKTDPPQATVHLPKEDW